MRSGFNNFWPGLFLVLLPVYTGHLNSNLLLKLELHFYSITLIAPSVKVLDWPLHDFQGQKSLYGISFRWWWALTGCPALSPVLSAFAPWAPAWTNYSHFPEGTMLSLVSVPLLTLFSFSEHASWPLPTNSHSFFSTQLNCYLPLPCLQKELITWPSVHHGTSSYLECTNVRFYVYLHKNIVSVCRVGVDIGIE